MGWWQNFIGLFGASGPPVVDYGLLPPARMRYAIDDGEKFAGGFGPTYLLQTDYYTLRARSAQLFETNHYARGVIRRLVTAEVNTGLNLEAVPEEKLLGKEEDSLADWSESIENRFRLWGSDARLCHQAELANFDELQEIARTEALVSGDVLVVLLQNPRTKLPRVMLISGSAVRTPSGLMNGLELPNGNRIVHGVELAPDGRHVAYHVCKDPILADGGLATTTDRLPAYGEKSGRRQAWLLYGTDKRMDDVRGKPLLSLMLQSLREIDRYRDSVQRKATINSMVAMFIKKMLPGKGTKAISGGGIRRGTDKALDNAGQERRFHVSEHIPGLVLDELAQGEEPFGFSSHGTDEKFGDFERAILTSVAWTLEIPPEILLLSFNSNYSASQAAINEFKIYLNKVRTRFGTRFCQPIYEEWLVASVRAKRIEAPGLLRAIDSDGDFEIYGAWVSADWAGQIKPAVDLSKLVGGYTDMVDQGFITRDRATRELTGMRYSKNVQKLRLENEQLAEANKAINEAVVARASVPRVPAPNDDTDDDEKSKTEETASERPRKFPPVAAAPRLMPRREATHVAP